MSVQYGGDNITFGDGSTLGSGWTGFKNRIINGDMTIFQRGTATTADAQYSIDRWRFVKTNDATESVSQNTDAPAGFINSLRNTISIGDATIGAGQYSGFEQSIEGFNCADLAWGTANAQPVTLSFWVRSSVTGQYTGNVRNSSNARIFPFNYNINSANTWEYKTITIAGDTTGTWLTNNGIGINVALYAALGSNFSTGTANTWGSNYGCGTPVNGIASNGNIFAITGVQLEKGSTATSFDYRPYGTELQLCQRYCYVYSAASPYNTQGGGYARVPIFGNGTNTTLWYPQFPVQLRVCPSLTYNVNLGASTSLEGYNYTSNTAMGNISSISLSEGSVWTAQVGLNFASGCSSGHVCSFRWTGTSSSNFIFSAEL